VNETRVDNSSPNVDRRQAILRAAVNVFAEKGYHGCRISDVAQEAGVAYGLVYHYFRNKEELLHSVFTDGWSRFASNLTRLVEADLPLREKVGSIVDHCFDVYRDDPRSMRVMILEVARTPAFRDSAKRNAFEEGIALTARLLEGARARGEVRDGIDPWLAAAMLFGAVEVLLTAFVLGTLDFENEADVEKARKTAVEIFVGGVGRPGA